MFLFIKRILSYEMADAQIFAIAMFYIKLLSHINNPLNIRIYSSASFMRSAFSATVRASIMSCMFPARNPDKSCVV